MDSDKKVEEKNEDNNINHYLNLYVSDSENRIKVDNEINDLVTKKCKEIIEHAAKNENPNFLQYALKILELENNNIFLGELREILEKKYQLKNINI